MRQREERGPPPHRLAVVGDELEPAHHRVAHPVAKAHAEQVRRRQVLYERRVAGVVEGERQVDAAAREGEAREARIDARVLHRMGERTVGPAVEGHVRQRRLDHRRSRRREMVFLGRAGFGHGVGLPKFVLSAGGHAGRPSLYSAFLPKIETQGAGRW